MQEPEVTIRNKLKSKWELTEIPVSFRIEEAMSLQDRFRPYEVSIEICGLTAPHQPRNNQRTIVREIITVNIWQRIKNKSESGKNKAVTTQQKIIDHVKAIIKANRKTMTDIKYVYFGNTRKLKGFDQDPPFLHTIIELIALYWV